MKSAAKHLGQNLVGLSGIVILLVIWEVVVRVFNIRPIFLPGPTLVWQKLWADPELITTHASITGYETLYAVFLSVSLGIIIGVLLFYVKVLNRMLFPFIIASQVVPKIAVAPLIIVWLGLGPTPRLTVAILISFFPVLLSMITGLNRTPKDRLLLAKLYQTSEWKVFWLIRLPGSLPYLFSGIKLAASTSIIGILVGEFINSSRGLGYSIIQFTARLETASTIAGIFLIVAISLAIFGIVLLLESLLVRWKEELA